GDYLYANIWTPGDTHPGLTRIAKSDGTAAFAVISHGVVDISGIATDGKQKLYISDTASSAPSVAVITSGPTASYPSANLNPTMENGSVKDLPLDPKPNGANGAAVIGNTTYTADGNRIVQIDNASGQVTPLTGKVAAVDYCQSFPSDATAQFRTDSAPLRVVASDGRFIYATDACGIRRIDPTTKAVTSLTVSGNFSSRIASVAIGGQYLYAVDNTNGGLTKIDLDSGASTLINSSISGAIAANDTRVWVLNGTVLLEIDRSSGNAYTVSTSVATNGHTPTAMLYGAGDLYFGQWNPGDVYPIFMRVSTVGGNTTVVAASGFENITGISADRDQFYVTDLTADGASLKRVQPAAAYAYPAPADDPVMEAGSLSQRSDTNKLGGANGVAVIGNTTYTADGNRIVKIGNSSGTATPLTGKETATDSCRSFPNDTAAQFRTDYAPLKVVGTDGRFIYATDACGIRRIDPTTKAVTSLTTSGNFSSRVASISIAGRYLYAVDNSYGGLTRVDLNTGASAVLDPSLTGAIAADRDYVWVINNDRLIRFDPASRVSKSIAPVATVGRNPTALLSVGGYLYANLWRTGDTYPLLIRIDKNTGYEKLILDHGLTNVTSIAADHDQLAIADGAGTNSAIKTVLGRPAEPASAHGDTLHAGERLNPGEQLTSSNGRYVLVMQLDGNLVEYDGTQAVWASGTYGQTGSYLEAKADGTFVISNPTNSTAWSTNTAATTGSSLKIQDDRNVVVYAPDGRPLWASNTNI
ncbi:hypothetical protein, partial [Paractinoplanes toevensis]|uniref:hypothetical protein n=1 Tax=Paractinoplanes toevensis TaxID=571911 RepID=UPI003F68C9E6